MQNFSQLDADGGPTLPKTKTDGALARESLYNKDYFICFGIKTHEVEDHKGWPVACCWPTDSAAAADTVIRFLGWHYIICGDPNSGPIFPVNNLLALHKQYTDCPTKTSGYKVGNLYKSLLFIRNIF